jgi:hypothetical protein
VLASRVTLRRVACQMPTPPTFHGHACPRPASRNPAKPARAICSGAAERPGDADGSTACPVRLCGLLVQFSQHRGGDFARHFPELLDQKCGALVAEAVAGLSRHVDNLCRRCRGAVCRGLPNPLDRPSAFRSAIVAPQMAAISRMGSLSWTKRPCFRSVSRSVRGSITPPVRSAAGWFA